MLEQAVRANHSPHPNPGGERYLRQAGQINESQVQNVWRVDLQVYRLPVDALVVAGNARRLTLNLPLYVAEIGEPSIWDVVELGPFRPAGSVGRPVRIVSRLGSRVILGNIDELENQGPSGDDAASPWEKVAPDNIL